MKCKKCGQEIGKSQFCGYCGHKNTKKSGTIKIIIFSLILGLLVFGLAFLFFNLNNYRMVKGLSDYFEINKAVMSLESEFVDLDGYVNTENVEVVVSKVGEYAKQLLEEGRIKDYNETKGISVWIKFKNGLEYVYMPSEEGCDSTAITTYQPCLSTYELELKEYSCECVDYSAENIAYKLDEYVFENNLDDSEVTFESLKNITENQLIIWHGHGGYSNEIHSFIVTGVALDEAQFLLNPVYYVKNIGYTEDYLKGRIVCTSSGYAAVTSKFFDEYLDEIDGSVLYLGTCHSGDDEMLANTFLSKGAQAVIANESTICTEYDLVMIKSVFAEMMNVSDDEKYCTLQQALQNSIKRNGESCCSEHNGKVIVFGDESFRLYSETGDGEHFNHGTYLVEAGGKVIYAQSDGIYYREYAAGEEIKIISVSNVDVLMSNGQTVYFSVGSGNAYETTARKISRVEINDGTTEKLFDSEGKVDFVTCYNNCVYYLDTNDDTTFLKKYDLVSKSEIVFTNSDLGMSDEQSVVDINSIGSKIYIEIRTESGLNNSIMELDLVNETASSFLEQGEIISDVCNAQTNKICFSTWSRDSDWYIYSVNLDGDVDKSAKISSELILSQGVISCDGSFALMMSDYDDSNFDLYKVYLTTGNIDVIQGGAGYYKYKGVAFTYDLKNRDDIYLAGAGSVNKRFNGSGYDEVQTENTTSSYSYWIVDGYVAILSYYKEFEWSEITEETESSESKVVNKATESSSENDGKIYSSNVIQEYKNEAYYCSSDGSREIMNLPKLDFSATGLEYKKLPTTVDGGVQSFLIYNDFIYYIGGYENKTNSQGVYASGTLYRCDLDGNNVKLISNDVTNLCFQITNNKLYYNIGDKLNVYGYNSYDLKTERNTVVNNYESVGNWQLGWLFRFDVQSGQYVEFDGGYYYYDPSGKAETINGEHANVYYYRKDMQTGEIVRIGYSYSQIL